METNEDTVQICHWGCESVQVKLVVWLEYRNSLASIKTLCQKNQITATLQNPLEGVVLISNHIFAVLFALWVHKGVCTYYSYVQLLRAKSSSHASNGVLNRGTILTVY